jgi:hypothetical protein
MEPPSGDRVAYINRTPSKTAICVVAIALAIVAAATARAQGTAPPGYPATNQAYPDYQVPAPPPPQAPPQSHAIRDLFAGTIATVLQTATGGLAASLNGKIMDWFAKKQGQAPTLGYNVAGNYPYQAAATTDANAYPGATTYPTASASTYPASTAQISSYPSSSDANSFATPAAGYDSTLYAGIAYEVHALLADGRSTPISQATYEFRTGDKFMVYYRPSLPGRMEIYNINPAGQQTLIDATNMAAGQMTALGPYQFTNLSGDESLRLVLSPCSNPQLLAATRDIVKVDAAAPISGGGVQLSSCGMTTSRGLSVHTRDIQKVAVDGTTSFALDPVSHQELASGQVVPRETTIVFHHR